MPTHIRTVDDRPKHTPSFVCEVPLWVTPTQERTLLARLEAARQVYNACLGEARNRARLVRRKLGPHQRFYAQLVCEGTPYRKPQHTLGRGMAGLDLGPSTIAVVADQDALLQPFCPEVTPNWQDLRRLDRKLDRQRRANNPAHYDEQGRVKPGRKRWAVSKRQRQVQARRREVYRKLTATRKRSHGQLAHRVLALGDTFHLEQLSYRAWQKLYGRSVNRSAPGRFVRRLSRLAASAGGQAVELNTRRAKLSQRCQCGVVVHKPLRQRWHHCDCGVTAQRDLYSAHLARFVNPQTAVLEARQAEEAWRRGEPLVQAAYQHAITNQRASGRHVPSSFGHPPVDPSRSASPAAGRPANAESRDCVVRRQRRARARKRWR